MANFPPLLTKRQVIEWLIPFVLVSGFLIFLIAFQTNKIERLDELRLEEKALADSLFLDSIENRRIVDSIEASVVFIDTISSSIDTTTTDTLPNIE